MRFETYWTGLRRAGDAGRRLCVVLLMLTLCLTACTSDGDPTLESPAEETVEAVAVQLALSVPKAGGVVGLSADTRMTAEMVQAEVGTDANKLRDIQDIYLIPFSTRGKISESDRRTYNNIELGDQTGTYTSDSYLHPYWFYQNVYVPAGTSSFLFYGRAVPDATKTKFQNGSLIRHDDILRGPYLPSSIHFDPDPIYTGDVTTLKEMGNNACAMLNDILSASYTESSIYYRRNNNWSGSYQQTWTWSNCEDATLSAYYSALATDDIRPASREGITALLQDLYRKLKSYTSSDDTRYQYNGYDASFSRTNSSSYYLYYSRIYNGLRDAIIAKIEAYANVSGNGTTQQPYTLTMKSAWDVTGYGLPQGSISVYFNGTEFEYIDTDSSKADMPALDHYCYPAELYYYVNSRINASDIDDRAASYAPNTTWSDFVANASIYERPDATIYGDTKAVAIQKEIQYGVAKLEATVYADATLKDNSGSSGNNISLNNSSTIFPLRGILIGQQRSVGFDFEPLASATDDYYLYDTDLNSNIYLRTTESAANYTLTLQTMPEQRVYVILEFENNSGKDFIGNEGATIYQGTRFYLPAALNPSSSITHWGEKPHGDADEEGLREVFRQDCTTKVRFKVASLKDAYPYVPDLTDPKLKLSVQVEMDWIGATPKSGAMY